MQSLSLIAIFWIGLAIAFAYFLYNSVIKPLRLISYYRSTIGTKYKVSIEPFNPLIPTVMLRLKKEIEKYGDCAYTNKFILRDYQLSITVFKDQTLIILIDPNLIREFYQKNSEGYYIKATNDIIVDQAKYITGNGMSFSEGEQWKMKRKIISNLFNYDFIKDKIPTINILTKQFFDRLQQREQNKGKGEVKTHLDHFLQQIFGSVVMKCFFGNFKLREIQGQSAFTYFNKMSIKNLQRSFSIYGFFMGPKILHLNLRPQDREMSRMRDKFNNYARNIIKEQLEITKHNQNSECNNKTTCKGIFDLLVRQKLLKDESTQKIDKENKNYYKVEDLICDFKNFFAASTDTTADTTTILTYLLVKHKNIENKVRKQIQEVLDGEIQNITYEKLKQMKYLQKCQKESMRLYPPTVAPFVRQATHDHFLENLPIKKGTKVTASIISNHFKTQFYKNPQVFDPDRWDQIDVKKANPFSFFPFSFGSRNCIGQHLAMIQSKIAMIHLLTRYKQIKMEKPEFRYVFKKTFGPQKMITTLVK